MEENKMKFIFSKFGYLECLIILQIVVLTWTFTIPMGSTFELKEGLQRNDENDEDAIEHINKRYQFMTPNQWVDKWKKSNTQKRSFAFSAPSAWADKWKKAAGKRSFSFSTPNGWADKWKKSSLKRSGFSFSTPNSWADQWKRSGNADLRNDIFSMLRETSEALAEKGTSNVCDELQDLVELQHLSQSALNEMIQECTMENSPQSCLMPARKSQIEELYNAVKIHADMIEWCQMQHNKMEEPTDRK